MFFLKEAHHNTATSISSIASFYNVEGKLLSTQYKNHIGGFEHWEQLHHAQEYVVFKKNMGEYLSMDETFSLARRSLYHSDQ